MKICKVFKKNLIKHLKKFNSEGDYYSILNVKKNAKSTEIKKGYYKLVKKHHPDTGGSEKKIKILNQAYEILSNPEKKKNYDNKRNLRNNNSNEQKKDFNHNYYKRQYNYGKSGYNPNFDNINENFSEQFYRRKNPNFRYKNNDKDYYGEKYNSDYKHKRQNEEFYRKNFKKNFENSKFSEKDIHEAYKEYFSNFKGNDFKKDPKVKFYKDKFGNIFYKSNENSSENKNKGFPPNDNLDSIIFKFINNIKEYYEDQEKERLDQRNKKFNHKNKEIKIFWNDFKKSSEKNGIIRGIYDAYKNINK